MASLSDWLQIMLAEDEQVFCRLEKSERLVGVQLDRGVEIRKRVGHVL